MLDTVKKILLKPLAIRTLNKGVPFARLCGTKLDVMGSEKTRVSIQPRSELMNDEGEWQAGVIFTLAETASGAAITSVLLPVILKCRPVVSNANFTMLANSNTALYATASVAESEKTLLKKLVIEGKIEFSLNVDVWEEETSRKIAVLNALWHVKLVS